VQKKLKQNRGGHFTTEEQKTDAGNLCGSVGPKELLKERLCRASSPHMRRKKQLTVKTPSGEPVRQSTLITRKQNLAGE
jgi:hypothetical protein